MSMETLPRSTGKEIIKQIHAVGKRYVAVHIQSCVAYCDKVKFYYIVLKLNQKRGEYSYDVSSVNDRTTILILSKV